MYILFFTLNAILINTNSQELPNRKIEFNYIFGPVWGKYSNPSAVLSKKNNQLNLEIIGAAGSEKCYRNLLPSLEFEVNFLILYFNPQLRGCEKVRIIFDRDGIKNEAQIFETDKWSSFTRIKNIKIKEPNIISMFIKEASAQAFAEQGKSAPVSVTTALLVESEKENSEPANQKKQKANNSTENEYYKKSETTDSDNIKIFNEIDRDNKIYSEYFKGDRLLPQVTKNIGCINIDFNSFGRDYRKTICTGEKYRQIIDQLNNWDILGITLNSPISIYNQDNEFDCLLNGGLDKNTKPEKILSDGIICSYKKMIWQFQFSYDKELGYFYTESLSVEQCGPYEIQKDSDLIKRLVLKYGEPIKVDFNSPINSIIEIRFENKISNESLSIELDPSKNSIGGGLFKTQDCNGGRSLRFLLYKKGDSAVPDDVFKKIKRIKRNAKSSINQPQF